MKLTAEFDPDFVAMPRPKRQRIRTRRLLILCAPSAAIALALANTNSAPGSPIVGQALIQALNRSNLASRQGGPGTPLRLTPVRGDHFVWVASPAIDPNMVHAAPEGIDEAMVLPARDSQLAR